jgi:hypothetical protein
MRGTDAELDERKARIAEKTFLFFRFPFADLILRKEGKHFKKR